MKLILLAILAITAVADECGPNEVYTECGSLARPSCANRAPMSDRMCHQVCECIEGFVFEEGKCVPTEDCGKYCAENEEFVKEGHICEKLCRWPDRSPCPSNALTKNMCMCKEGFFRDGDAVCRKTEDCKNRRQ